MENKNDEKQDARKFERKEWGGLPEGLVLSLLLVVLTNAICTGQPILQGRIAHYPNDTLTVHKYYGDTSYLNQEVMTDAQGRFSFQFPNKITPPKHIDKQGMYRISLKRGQSFHILYDGDPVKIETLYRPSPFYNIATDSLKVFNDKENSTFYEFQRLQKEFRIANAMLLKMMRVYPRPDPFHEKIRGAYFGRHEQMEKFVEEVGSGKLAGGRGQLAVDSSEGDSGGGKERSLSMVAKVALAYYQPVNPDWKQPDPWRDSIISGHYFEYFDPSDPFYLQTHILPEKMDDYLRMRTNKRDEYGRPVKEDSLYWEAAIDYLEQTRDNEENLAFCLNYFLEKFSDERRSQAFLKVYDRFLEQKEGSCGAFEKDRFTWARKKADILKGVQVGRTAPDFEIMDGNLNLYDLQSRYTLVLFWASWCGHCQQVVPEIKTVVDQFTGKSGNIPDITVVAVSLDREREAWKTFVREHGLLTWLNTSELKGWDSEVAERYNVHATPTLFLLDREKRIVAKLKGEEELKRALKEEL